MPITEFPTETLYKILRAREVCPTWTTSAANQQVIDLVLRELVRRGEEV